MSWSDFCKFSKVFPNIWPLLSARSILFEISFFSFDICAGICWSCSFEFVLSSPSCTFSLLNLCNFSEISPSFEVSAAIYPMARLFISLFDRPFWMFKSKVNFALCSKFAVCARKFVLFWRSLSIFCFSFLSRVSIICCPRISCPVILLCPELPSAVSVIPTKDFPKSKRTLLVVVISRLLESKISGAMIASPPFVDWEGFLNNALLEQPYTSNFNAMLLTQEIGTILKYLASIGVENITSTGVEGSYGPRNTFGCPNSSI